jgi:protease-4
MPRDWMGRQAWLRQRWALQGLADAQGLLSGSAIRAACLECRGYGAPHGIPVGRSSLLAWLTPAILR